MSTNDRKIALFSAIINEHIRNCGAVGSKLLVDKYQLGVSPATVRNDMMELEKEGYLTHQYTSAGRIPTEKGWKYYLDNLVHEKELATKEKGALTDAVADAPDYEAKTKRLAKALAELSQEAVVVAFSPDDIYYTGISCLFSQPEFRDFNIISHITEVIDHLDDIVHDIFPNVKREIETLIGSENPFGKECGTMMMQYTHDGKNSVMAIVGPMRMDYAANSCRLRFAQELLETSQQNPHA